MAIMAGFRRGARWALAGAMLCSGLSASAGEDAQAVDFSLTALSGDTVSLSDYRGQWVVVNYWATWCGPCREEIPQLSALHQARDDVTVLGLAFEAAEPKELRAFLDEHPASYPILPVSPSSPPEALERPRALPTTLIIAPDGTQSKRFMGPVTRDQVESYIDERRDA